MRTRSGSSIQPAWTSQATTPTPRASGPSFAAGIDYLIGEPDHVGLGIGTQAVRRFTRRPFAEWPDIEDVVVTPQTANLASCRVLEKAGYELTWTGVLDSDDPADAGVASLYVRHR